jgi:3-methyladenine DNA glycosylase AlkD
MKKKISARHARRRLRQFSSSKNAKIAGWFFKTEDGGYSAHDRFIGVRVPKTRVIAKEFQDLKLSETQSLLKSKIHEERLLALIILVNRTKKAEAKLQKDLTKFYLKNLKHVNNWDLVDVSAEHLLGSYLFHQTNPSQTKTILSKLAKSKNLWFRRVSIIATFYFIRKNEFSPTLQIAKVLLNDHHDLIHKAVGWMIRETGNRNLKAEEIFLKTCYKKMPRTMLRYAIEKFPEKRRLAYLRGQV